MMADKISKFDEIKNGLEDVYSYIIVEMANRKFEFQNLIDLLSQHKCRVIKSDIYHDAAINKFYLVVKFDTFVTDDIMMEVFKRIPDDCSAYLYNGVCRE